jgi:hypothetical protein
MMSAKKSKPYRNCDNTWQENVKTMKLSIATCSGHLKKVTSVHATNDIIAHALASCRNNNYQAVSIP